MTETKESTNRCSNAAKRVNEEGCWDCFKKRVTFKNIKDLFLTIPLAALGMAVLKAEPSWQLLTDSLNAVILLAFHLECVHALYRKQASRPYYLILLFTALISFSFLAGNVGWVHLNSEAVGASVLGGIAAAIPLTIRKVLVATAKHSKAQKEKLSLRRIAAKRKDLIEEDSNESYNEIMMNLRAMEHPDPNTKKEEQESCTTEEAIVAQKVTYPTPSPVTSLDRTNSYQL